MAASNSPSGFDPPATGSPPSPPPADAYLRSPGPTVSVDAAFKGSNESIVRMVVVIVLAVSGFAWVGTLVNGQVMKGISSVVATAAIGVLGFVTCGLAWLLLVPLHFLMLVDTIVLALRIQRGEPVGPWDFFWTPSSQVRV